MTVTLSIEEIGKWTCTANGTWVLAPPPPQDQAWLRKQQLTQKEHRT